MKFSTTAASSSRRKQRKAHFTASSGDRAKRMSVTLSKDLRTKYGIRALPIRKGDTVKCLTGGENIRGREGKVKTVYRLKYIVLVDGIEAMKKNGQQRPLPLHPSNLVITELSDKRELTPKSSETPAE